MPLPTENPEEVEDDDLPQGEEPEIVETPEKPEKPDDLRSIVAELAGVVKSQTKAPTEPELTQDQKDELWAVFKPEATRKDFMKKFFRLNPDATVEEEAEARSLFSEMQAGLTKQAIVGARNLIQIEMAKLREEIKPIQGYVSASEARERKHNFDTAFPALADSKFNKLLVACANNLSNQEFKSEDAFFKAVADAATEQIKLINPDFDLGAEQPPTKKPGTTPRLPRTSVGGTGGNGGGGVTPKQAKVAATEEFLNDD